MPSLFILHILVLCSIVSNVLGINGTMSGSANIEQLTYSINSTGKNVLGLQFKVTNINYANVVMVAAFTPISNTSLSLATIPQLIKAQDNLLNYMDINSAIGGVTQLVNIMIPSNSTTVYITLFNFDLPQITSDKSYTLYMSTLYYGKICYSCPYGAQLVVSSNPLACQCAPCSSNYVGCACQYYLNSISSGNTVNFDVSNNLQTYYRISSDMDVNLIVRQLTSTGGVTIYIQYQYQVGQLAGKLNVNYAYGLLPWSILVTSSDYPVTIPANGNRILLTFSNMSPNKAKISLNYLNNKSSHSEYFIGIIVGCIVGGCVVLIFLFCMIRRKCIRTTNTNNFNVPIEADPNRLEQEQINKFFPRIFAFQILEKPKSIIAAESSLSSNNDEISERQISMQECCICLEQLKMKEPINVTYCKHFFHNKCLVGWFEKNRNCPLCRTIFTNDYTRKRYKQVSKGRRLKGIDLIRAILEVPQPVNESQAVIQKQMLGNEVMSREVDVQDS